MNRILLIILTLLLPGVGSATDFELVRLATQLENVSARLAHDLRRTNGYSSVRHSANRLSREAALLADYIRRARGPSRVRSQYKDVARQYQRLEETFLRQSRGRDEPYLFNSMGLVSDLFTGLSNEFYYGSAIAASGYRAPTQVTPLIVTPVAPGGVRPRPPSGRVVVPNFDHRSARLDNRQQQRPSRLNYGRRSIGAGQYQQRSSVLQRQARQQGNQRQIQQLMSRRHGASDVRSGNHWER